jgi:hypothetical protein
MDTRGAVVRGVSAVALGVGFLQTRPPVRSDTAILLHDLGATVENANLPPWPGIPTPSLSANVPE